MNAINDYYDALERLKKNKPMRVPKGTAINKDTVAMEAGRGRGTIRNRESFKQLIEDINKASDTANKRTNKKATGEKLAAKDNEIEALKRENEILKTRYMSLLYQNYELANMINKAGLKPPSWGKARSISILDDYFV